MEMKITFISHDTPADNSRTDALIIVTDDSPNSVLILLLKMQFIKYVLCITIYLAVCVVLFKLKSSFYVAQETSVTVFVRNNQINQKQHSLESRTSQKSIDFEIKLLEHDEKNGQSISVQESAALFQQISKVCKRYNLKTPLIRRHFLYNSEHKSLYCWIRKVASTSFTKLFSDMKNRPFTYNYDRQVDFLSPRSLKELQHIVNDVNTFKLLVVRHPFQRLVSSYRDRIEDNTKHTAQAWIYIKQIFRLTRPELFHSNTTTGNFQQKVFTRDKRLKVIPTFKEFLEWLLQYSQEDVHWDKYYTHCSVCDVRYNYILKLDDYTYGQINYIFTKLGLDMNKVYLPKLERTRGGDTDFHVTCKYFSTLTRNMILKLYERYRIDFEMYNYDINRYMLCVNGEA